LTQGDLNLDHWWPEQPLAVVVGVGGLGRAVARRLGQTHKLLLCDLDPARLEAVAAPLREDGLQVHTAVCDVTSAASVRALAETAGRIGPVRTLAHVAGLSPSMADWRTILTVNLRGPALMADAMLPLTAPGAAAVFVASLAAHLQTFESGVLSLLDNPLASDWLEVLTAALGAQPSTAQAYMLSKVGLLRLCRRHARRWGERRARIVSLSPGLIATPMGRLEFRSEQKRELFKHSPLGRQGSMDEICDAVEFLVSDRASFISGTDLLVDGGIAAAVGFAN
jgi:NAD(P)-dependent dehydrogenase (short-subunit alcohol dehydrogenase family)